MALRLEDAYTNATAADASYPGGSFKNETVAGALDGTPLEKAWADDLLGSRDAVLSDAGQSYSGNKDTVLVSDFLDALKILLRRSEEVTITPGSDADVTLTSAQALFARLLLADGSWTSGHNIIVPDDERFYYIDNTGGTYDAVIKTSGGTGITVGNGKKRLVACDGTNVIDVLDQNNIESTTITPGSDADVTLTSAQELFGRLVLADGSWTSGHNIIVSTAERIYYVDNSGGTYDAVIKTSGGTGVTIQSGEKTVLICDGTNVIQPISFLSSRQLTGTATFTNSTNNIALTDIGLISGLEVGDVIQVSGSSNNDKEFTVEVITDGDNVIVNEAHAGGTTSKSLVDETVSVTVKLLAKWYNAPVGLGQGWVDVSGSRSSGNLETNDTKRSIDVAISVEDTNASATIDFEIDGNVVLDPQVFSTGSCRASITITIPAGSTYKMTFSSGDTISKWWELR